VDRFPVDWFRRLLARVFFIIFSLPLLASAERKPAGVFEDKPEAQLTNCLNSRACRSIKSVIARVRHFQKVPNKGDVVRDAVDDDRRTAGALGHPDSVYFSGVQAHA
jgi:hypothetical protein